MSSTQNFVAVIHAFAGMTSAKLEEIRRKSAFDVFASIIYSTPVDSGQLRNNWFASIDSPSTESVLGEASDSAVTVERVRAVLFGKDVAGDIWFCNNMPYGPKIEYTGWSGKAPSGMVRINTIRWPDIVAANVKGVR